MKKLFTYLATLAVAVSPMLLSSCDDDGGGLKPNTVKFNSYTYTIPSSYNNEFYHYEYEDNYQLYLEFETTDGNYVDINIDLAKSKVGATPYTLAEGDVYWYFSAELNDSDGDEIVDLWGDNDDMSSVREDEGLASGKIMMQALGNDRFKLVASAVGIDGNTFSINFEGILPEHID